MQRTYAFPKMEVMSCLELVHKEYHAHIPLALIIGDRYEEHVGFVECGIDTS